MLLLTTPASLSSLANLTYSTASLVALVVPVLWKKDAAFFLRDKHLFR